MYYCQCLYSCRLHIGTFFKLIVEVDTPQKAHFVLLGLEIYILNKYLSVIINGEGTDTMDISGVCSDTSHCVSTRHS